MEGTTDDLAKKKKRNSKSNKPKMKPRGRPFPKGNKGPEHLHERWQGNDEQAFWNFIEDTRPRVKQGSRYSEWVPTDEQRKLVTAIFERDGTRRKHRLVLAIQPRRHGKSTLFLLVVIFYFISRRNFTIGLLGNTDDHTHRTMYKRIEAIIRNTPALKLRCNPDKNFLTDHARLQDPVASTTWQNRIIKCTQSMSGAFGDSLDILHVSDLHQNPDMEVFEAWRGALIDSAEGITLIDANVDYTGGPVHELQQLAENEEAVFCSHISYTDLDDYTLRAPSWLDRTEARIAQKRDLDVAFNRDFLGQRSAIVNRLFSDVFINLCKDAYRIPVTDHLALAAGRTFAIGGGLDRSKNLLAMGNTDSTVWTTMMKVATIGGEPEYYILNQRKFLLNTSREIKAEVMRDHKQYGGFTNCSLENYEVSDLRSWFADVGIQCELISPTDNRQNSSFPYLYRLFREGRIHLPENCTDLIQELQTFVYTQRKSATGSYVFSHISSKFHDDHIYSLNWAVESLRDSILDLFNMNYIDCKETLAYRRALCFIMGGSKSLMCSQQCPAYYEVAKMFRDYKSFHALDSELDIASFYKSYVKSTDGIVTYQGV